MSFFCWKLNLSADLLFMDEKEEVNEVNEVNFVIDLSTPVDEEASSVESVVEIVREQKESEECPICFENLTQNNKDYFPCGHVVCFGCVEGLEDRGDNRCPIWRTEF